VYYRELTVPPPGSHFSSEWGLDNAMGMGTRGDWLEYDPDYVRDTILERAGDPTSVPHVRSLLRLRLCLKTQRLE
jgi:hypothetical protein